MSLLIFTSCGTNNYKANLEQIQVSVTPSANNTRETTLSPVPTKSAERIGTTQDAIGTGDVLIRGGEINSTPTKKPTSGANQENNITPTTSVKPTDKPTTTNSGITVIAQTSTTLTDKEKEKLLTDLKDEMEELLKVINRIKELDDQNVKLKF